MREIKFRVWCKNKNEWEKDYLAIDLKGMLIDIEKVRPYSQENHIIMQFTGLLDKNKKEIYEGDILSGPYSLYNTKTYNKHYPLVNVIFMDGKFVGDIDRDQKEMKGYPDVIEINDLCEINDWMEVIGNIYETPIDK